jgi:hypothetical protein
MTLLREYGKLKYLLWAGSQLPAADTSCPACNSSSTHIIKRKYAVTSLWGCTECFLMFRVPKDNWKINKQFYNNDYDDGFTTDLPTDVELDQLKRQAFKNTEKDYSGRIGLIEAAGVSPGQTIFEFGCSWGYSSWQIRRAGYRVYSYEVSKVRARYAADKLGCTIVNEPDDVPEKVDCFYSAHVIEHLPNPRLIWEKASQLVKPEGLIILLMPNGEPTRAQKAPNYHLIWGQVHPLVLCARALKEMAANYGFKGLAYSSPYDHSMIANGEEGQLEGDELLFVARKV